MRATNIFWRYRWNMSDTNPTILFSHPAIGTNIFYTLAEVQEMAEKKDAEKLMKIPGQVIENALAEYRKMRQFAPAH